MQKKIDYNKLKRQEKQTCKGLAENGTKCGYGVEDGFNCCTRHSDMEDYTEEMFEKVQKCTRCPRPRWRLLIDGKYCVNCDEKYCKGPEADSSRCHLKKTPGKKFCSRNHAYMEDYTDVMMDNLKFCKGCKKWRYIGHFGGKETCEVVCQKRCASNREKARHYRGPQKLCQHDGCGSSVKITDNIFCKKHILDQFVIDAEKAGKKVCANYRRKCRTLLEKNYEKSRCEKCLASDRKKDTKRRADKKEKAIKNTTDTHQSCLDCGDMCEKKDFVNKDKISTFCSHCREKRLNYERRRIKNDTMTNQQQIRYMRHNSLRRNLNYNLSDEFSLRLLSLPCHYCNKYYSNVNFYGETYSKMGIDRIDNNGHYTEDNVVTACFVCNRMKHMSTYEDFFKYCYNIFENFGSENDWDGTIKVAKSSLKVHKAECARRHIKTQLTKEDIINITSKRCYYCDSKNKKNQIGIDRVDSVIGYTKANKLVACCGICNDMKVDTNIDVFYNNILDILLHKGMINKETYDAKHKIIKPPSSQIKWVNECLGKVYEYDGKENKDRRNVHNFDNPSQHYIDKIWRGFDVRTFSPELEFCETQEQMDTWMFFRIAISSHYPSKLSSVDKLILIRDRFTKQYVALTSLCRVRPGWSDKSTIGKLLRNDNVYNISTCVSIPPFSFNFNGGKLATMLMFSSEVYQYMKQKNIIIAGLTTYSLHGESIQYSDITNFKMIGYTQKNASGKDNTKVPMKVYSAMIRIMRKKQYPLHGSKVHNIKEYCANQGLIDATVHGVQRAIYFGTMGEDQKKSMNYLLGLTGEYNPTCKTVDEISKIWFTNYAYPRFVNLVKRNSVMVDYNYDTYYVDKSSYDRHRKKQSLLRQKQNMRDIEDKKRKIINCWFSNKTQSWSFIERETSAIVEGVDRRYISKLINQNDYSSLTHQEKLVVQNFIDSRDALVVHSEHIVVLDEKINAYIEQFRKFKENTVIEERHISVKKPRLYITTQNLNDVRMFNRFTKIEGLKQGRWTVHPQSQNDAYNLEMTYDDYEQYVKTDITTECLEFEHTDMIFKIGLTQTDKEFNLGDIEMFDAPIRITGKDNIFVNLRNSIVTNKIRATIEKVFDEASQRQQIVSIKIVPILNCHRIHSYECVCDICIAFLLKQSIQKHTYDDILINMTISRLRETKKREDEIQYAQDNDDCDSEQTDETDLQSDDNKQIIVAKSDKKQTQKADKIMRVVRVVPQQK